MVVYLRCSSNNRASSFYDSFSQAVQQFGLPSRVRSDQGRENVFGCSAHARTQRRRKREYNNRYIDTQPNALNVFGATYIAVSLKPFTACFITWR